VIDENEEHDLTGSQIRQSDVLRFSSSKNPMLDMSGEYDEDEGDGEKGKIIK
jgi:hypothetical protein